MDNKIEILLGSEKNLNSVNSDNVSIVELNNSTSEINEFTVNDVINSSEQFDVERSINEKYRIYGRIEYLSLLNGIINNQSDNSDNYSILKNIFNPEYNSNSKSILNSFDFYLVIPSTGYTRISNTDNYKRYFKVIATSDDFDIYPAGFSNNVYGERTFAFNFKNNFDVSDIYDNFGFPITELFLYPQYKVKKNAMGDFEKLKFITWLTGNGNASKLNHTAKNMVIGDKLRDESGIPIGDIVNYNMSDFSQTKISGQTISIITKYYNSGIKELVWNYDPFIPIRLRYLDNVVSTAKLSEINPSTTLLSVFNGTDVIEFSKSIRQTIHQDNIVLSNWDEQETDSKYYWNSNDGTLTFLRDNNFDIEFSSSIYLPSGTDKYIGEIVMEENIGSGFVEIANCRRIFDSSGKINGIRLNKSYLFSNQIRFSVRLIPNPNERRIFDVPDYATMIPSLGKYVWRNILPQGFTEPITNIGVDYPFVNGNRYVFTPILFSVFPDLSDDNTADVFDEINFNDDVTVIDITPITELSEIGKPCQ